MSVDVKPATPFSVGSAEKSVYKRNERIVLYAPPGWGKTRWASESENPIYLDLEDGSKNVGVVRFPQIPKTWQEVLIACRSVLNDTHDYRTFVVDTADWAEYLCTKYMLDRDGKKSVDAYGWGKGQDERRDEFKNLTGILSEIADKRSMRVIMLAHSTIRTVNNPGGLNYDQNVLQLSKKTDALVKQWSDCLLFGSYETYVKTETEKDTKGKAVQGKRVIYTKESAAWEAKNRFGLPDKIILPDNCLGFNEVFKHVGVKNG